MSCYRNTETNKPEIKTVCLHILKQHIRVYEITICPIITLKVTYISHTK